MVQQSFLLFSNSVKSAETARQYKFYLDKFIEHFHIKDYDSLASMKLEQLQIMIEDYVMDLKRRVSPNSVPVPMYAIQAFFESNDIELRRKKIRRMYPAKTKKTGSIGWSTKQIENMLKFTTNIRNKALIHFLASTGVRKGAIPDLKIRHLKN